MFISQAHAQAANQPPAGGEWFLPIMMIGLLVFMYFTTIRPQRKRQKEHAELVNSLGKGDEGAYEFRLNGQDCGLVRPLRRRQCLR